MTIGARAVIIATGGLTRLYRRNSASANMGGDGHALALRAGAELIDMEFVQFFPIGHLAPRLVGMDPIMWDPFRYKLGGQLLNSEGREFIGDYDTAERAAIVRHATSRSYAILKEIDAGRGSPSGGVYLSFRHIPETKLRESFGPIIDRLHANGIDLTHDDVEVSPIAHYHMGGIRVEVNMQSSVPGLFAAGEAVGGANGANRLSGNAIPEALVFGRQAGISAASFAKSAGPDFRHNEVEEKLDLLQAGSSDEPGFLPAAISELQRLMDNHVGPLRTEEGLKSALSQIGRLRSELGSRPPSGSQFATARRDWFDLRNMLMVSEAVTLAALARRESRGAHQREDFPQMDSDWTLNQTLQLQHGDILIGRVPLRSLRHRAGMRISHRDAGRIARRRWTALSAELPD